ncbi:MULTISPECIES: serine/threonine-protein kinase [Nostoc]|uniref:non-specific serine/threonine protein kinase n=1 Tax=Nostoc paludosum FACHB-159 TaxID=2692908 RepID=A0ABR8KDP6_9NOSO|nr:MULTISPECIES: serine/threonine-protein kinase [Nostoc]MBD2680591.1 serine/threonine protein kinase [Nostoc sp. FACHB-857]MBD2736983.1 serine/threonine protein kinase [Nostoc paludosum FACHB-159]
MQGQTIGGRYQIFTQLGQGGFGTTFLAQDMQRPGNPQCVVKHFKPLSTDAYTLGEAKRLFDREALILETLGKHDQIPQLLAHFEENQEFYLVQEFIPGHDITQEIPPLGKRLSESETIKLLKEILEILAFVHQYNVIHRDLKPANIRRRQLDNKIVLIDFGAVKQITTQMTNSQGQANFTVAIGTYGYMPSEQASGTPQLSSDIYAVGIIAIQALIGINPADFGTQGLPRNPHTGEIDWRNQIQVSQQLAEIIDTMVLYDFRQRYPTATSALQALEMLDKIPDTTIQKTLQLARPQKFFLSAGITAVVATISLWLLQLQTPSQNFLMYQDSSYGIKIQYPETWKIQETPNLITKELVTFLSPQQTEKDNFRELLTISVENFSGTLQESQDLFIKGVKTTLSDATIVNISETSLAKKRANQLIFIGKDGKKNLKNLQVWTLKGNQAYIITYSAAIDDYDRFLPTAEKMIESFEIH